MQMRRLRVVPGRLDILLAVKTPSLGEHILSKQYGIVARVYVYIPLLLLIQCML